MENPITSNFLRNLRPALAGLVTDHKIDTKERYATFIDLILRGKIKYQKKKGKKYYSLINKNNLLDYEKDLLVYIFKNKKTLELSEIQYELDQKNEEFSFAVAEEAIKQEIYTPTTKEKLTNIFNKYFRKGKSTLKKTMILFVSIWVFVFLSFGFLMLSALIGKPEISMWCICPTFLILFLVFGIYIIMGYLSQIYVGLGILTEFGIIKGKATEFEDKYLPDHITNQGSKIRKKYLELNDFLEKYPLKESRLSNEYVAYAIVFGLIENYTDLSN